MKKEKAKNTSAAPKEVIMIPFGCCGMPVIQSKDTKSSNSAKRRG